MNCEILLSDLYWIYKSAPKKLDFSFFKKVVLYLPCWSPGKIDWLIDASVTQSTHVSVPQPPPRRPLAYAEQHESDEEKQFRRVFQQLAGDVRASFF